LKALVVLKAETPPRAIGFVDGYDIAMTVLEATSWTESINRETISNLLRDAKYFVSRTAQHVTETSSHEPLNVVTTDTPLYEAVEMFAGGSHRALVLQNGIISNIVSQSDILKTMIIRHDLLGDKKDVMLQLTGLITEGVETVKDTQNVINCLRHMRNRSVNGVAVVDSQGVIVHNFSSSDLLYLTEDNFHLLALSVNDFLFRLYGYTKPPVVCRRDDKLENLLLKFSTYGVHRVFIVDNTNRPTGVITLTDLMRYLMTA